MCLLGAKRIRTTSYHPIANGLIERYHRQLKASLKAQANPTRWTDVLPMVLLGIRTALKDDLHCSAAELVYGTMLRLPGEFFVEPTVDALLIQRITPYDSSRPCTSYEQYQYASSPAVQYTLVTICRPVPMSSSDTMLSASHCNIRIMALSRFSSVQISSLQ